MRAKTLEPLHELVQVAIILRSFEKCVEYIAGYLTFTFELFFYSLCIN